MQSRSSLTRVITGVAVATGLLSGGAGRARAEVVQKPGFTLVLPAGWTEMPQEVLQAFHDEAVRRAPKSRIPRYDYGFQLAAAERWLTYPYILIQVNDAGRIPGPELRAMAAVDLDKGVDRQALSPVLSAPAISQMQFDAELQLVWMHTEADVVDVGRIEGLTAMIPTERGFINVNGYARRDDFDRFRPALRGMIRSVTLAPELRYRPHWTDRYPGLSRINWTSASLQAAIGALVGVVVTLLVRRKPALPAAR